MSNEATVIQDVHAHSATHHDAHGHDEHGHHEHHDTFLTKYVFKNIIYAIQLGSSSARCVCRRT